MTFGLNFPGVLRSQFGWWFWFSTVYLFIFLLIDLSVLLAAYFRAPRWNRNRYWYLILGLFIPWASSILSIPGWIMKDQDYLMVLSVAISVLIIAWGLLRSRILDILPIAREAILDQMSDAIIIIDSDGLIVELNQAAKAYSRKHPKLLIGQPIKLSMPELSHLTFDSTLRTPQEMEVALQEGALTKNIDLRISPLFDESKQIAGWLAIFHDITQKKAEENKLLNAEASAEKSLEEIQQKSWEINTIRKLTETLNQATSLRGALIPTLRIIQKLTESTGLWLCLLDQNDDFHRQIFFSANDELSPLHFFDYLPNSLECVHDLLNANLQATKHYHNRRTDGFAAAVPAHDYLAFPLYSSNNPLGILNLSLSDDKSPEKDSIELIETICASLSTTLERVRLIKNEYSQRRESEAFRQINAALTASLNMNDVLDVLLKQVARLVPLDSGSVMLVEEDKSRIIRQVGYEFLGAKINENISHLVFQLAETKNLQRVIETQKPVIINDIQHNPDWFPTISSQSFQSWIGAPVLINNRVAMIFSLDKKEKNFFRPKHVDLLTAFCNEASLAIQNARLYEAGQKRINELENLQDVMHDISSQLDVQPLLRNIMERALLLLGSSSGVLGLYQEDLKAFKIAISINGGEDLAGNIVPAAQGLMGEVARIRRPITIDNYSAYPKRLEKYMAAFPHAVLEVPLLAGEKLVGVLAIGDSDPQRKYNDDDIRLLSLFAQQTTIALTNARLFTDAEQRAEEAETLRQASAIVASTLKQKQALHLILAQLAKVVPYDSASIMLNMGDELELVDGSGTEELPTPIGMRIRLDQKQPGAQVFRDKKSLIVNHMRQEYPSFFEFNQADIRSWLGVPLIYKNRTLGILSLDSLVENRYTENHAHMASAFADQVAVALENVRMYENALKSAKRFATLYTLSQRISLNLQPQEVYQAIHKASLELMPADAFILSLYDYNEKIINNVYFIDHGIQQETGSQPLGQGLFSQAILENRSLLFNSFDEQQLKETHAVVIGDEKDISLVKSAIIVPLRTGQQIKGILSVQSYQPNAYTEEDKETLEMLATQSAIALENARLFTEIQELAMTDSLTKIYNRRKFFELAEIEFERARRYKRPLSAIMMDIDLFKNVNDTYGHAAGDVVLRKIAEVCKQTIRNVDILARYGGEEFVVILPETTPSEAGLTAERLRQTVARTLVKVGDVEIQVSLSFGVVGQDSDCKNIEELLDRSDQALYTSKNSGRNRVTIWTPNPQPEAETKTSAIKP